MPGDAGAQEAPDDRGGAHVLPGGARARVAHGGTLPHRAPLTRQGGHSIHSWKLSREHSIHLKNEISLDNTPIVPRLLEKLEFLHNSREGYFLE